MEGAGEVEVAEVAVEAEVAGEEGELECAVGTPDTSRTRCPHFPGRPAHSSVRSTFDAPSASTRCR